MLFRSVPGTERSFLLRSRYVADQRPDPLPGMMHSTSGWRAPLDLAGRSTFVSGLVWRMAHAWALKEGRSYVDDLLGFTFFMDPNSRAKRFGRSVGFSLRLSQQSHLVPLDRTVEFLQAVGQTVKSHRIRPILQDILLVPEDPDCLLSSSHALRGFLVNVAFEKSSQSAMRQIGRAHV